MQICIDIFVHAQILCLLGMPNKMANLQWFHANGFADAHVCRSSHPMAAFGCALLKWHTSFGWPANDSYPNTISGNKLVIELNH